MLIPTVLNNFNMYGESHKFLGLSPETTLPNFEYLTETIDGAGIGGDRKSVV